MRKFTLLFYALLLATVGAWAQDATKSTTDWIDYTTLFNSSGWVSTFTSKKPSVYNVPVTIQATSPKIGTSAQEKVNRPWLVGGGNTFTISVPEGYKIAAYQITTKYVFPFVSGETAAHTFTYMTADGTETSKTQSTSYTTTTVEGLDVQSFTLITDNITNNGVFNGRTTDLNGIYLYNLRLKLIMDLVDANINVKNVNEDVQYTETVKLPVGETVTLKDYVSTFSFVTYGDETGLVVNGPNTFNLSYTVDEAAESKFPFAASYEELTAENSDKWLSMFTLNGRMHVYDDASEGNVYEYMEGPDGIGYEIVSSTKKYPTIDKATFTRLNPGFFWGFVRANRFSPTYIYNKGAADKKLYLTLDGEDKPLLFTNENGQVSDSWVTNEWVICVGQASTENNEEIQYYGIKASGTEWYISNNGNKGYMTTDAEFGNGSNIKLTPELKTYNILKERALAAPCNAVHSLDAASRELIKGLAESEQTVGKYDEIINTINTKDNGTGFIEFVDGGYYFLRNYTPAGENQKIFVLTSEDGSIRTAKEVTEGEGDADNVMTFFDINAIWQIATDASKPGEAPGTGIGASRTIARKVTHANSSMQLGDVNNESLVANGSGSDFYFIELGAGQHFMKNVQYNGSGQQATAKPLSCTDEGIVQEGAVIHKKNTRDAWYGIQVTEIPVTLDANGGGYATIHLPFGVTLPEESDLIVYAVTDADGSDVTMTKVNSIPANEGVILKGTAGQTYTLTINDNVKAWEKGYNKLEGSNIRENVSVEAYILSKSDDNEVGLRKLVMTEGSWLNNDNQAYLPADAILNPEDVDFLSFDFGIGVGLDIINSAEPLSDEIVVYDLSGRRVSSAQKGMYIVNGKKVVR